MMERDAKEQELVELLKLTPQIIWNNDLDNFLAEWRVSVSSIIFSKLIAVNP